MNLSLPIAVTALSREPVQIIEGLDDHELNVAVLKWQTAGYPAFSLVH